MWVYKLCFDPDGTLYIVSHRIRIHLYGNWFCANAEHNNLSIKRLKTEAIFNSAAIQFGGSGLERELFVEWWAPLSGNENSITNWNERFSRNVSLCRYWAECKRESCFPYRNCFTILSAQNPSSSSLARSHIEQEQRETIGKQHWRAARQQQRRQSSSIISIAPSAYIVTISFWTLVTTAHLPEVHTKHRTLSAAFCSSKTRRSKTEVDEWVVSLCENQPFNLVLYTRETQEEVQRKKRTIFAQLTVKLYLFIYVLFCLSFVEFSSFSVYFFVFVAHVNSEAIFTVGKSCRFSVYHKFACALRFF